jgi:predicted nucleic acid-binding protein
MNEFFIGQASTSYYVDACFILGYFPGSRGYNKVHDFLEEMEGCELVISNHTFTEVVHVLYRQMISKAIEIFHRCRNRIGERNNLSRLTKEEQFLLRDVSASRVLYHEAEAMGLIQRNQVHVWSRIGELIKSAKQNRPRQRHVLTTFYREAVTQFKSFLADLEEEGYTIGFADSRKDDKDYAEKLMVEYQLETTDALHLAIACNHDCDYFVTLDGDYEHISMNHPVIEKLA